MITEAEAKTKWCPFARQLMKIRVPIPPFDAVDVRAIASANRFDGDAMSTCIGSRCMAWRTTKRTQDETIDDAPVITYGFCGLAGTP